MGFILNARRLIFGRKPGAGSTFGSAIAGANRVGPYGTVSQPEGQFDRPPDEDVLLPDDVPRELRDSDRDSSR